MDDSAILKPVPLPRRSSVLRRGNYISTPAELPLPNSTAKPLHCSDSFQYQNGIAPVLDFELVSSLKSSLAYISLKDLLPSYGSGSGTAFGSPTAASAANSSCDISIRNRLVKQAAWAYLQPMSSSPGSSGSHFLSRLCLRLSSGLTDCLAFLKSRLLRATTRLFDQILRAFGLLKSRYQ